MNTPTPRHLILNLLLASETGTLSAAEAVKACDLFGISGNSARVALARLASADMIEAVGRATYKLGKAGVSLAKDVSSWRTVEDRLGEWDGSWIAVLTAGLTRKDRSVLRVRERALGLVGFRELDAGLSIRPDNLISGVDGARDRLRRLGLEKEALVFQLRGLEPSCDKAARKLWDSAALARGYRDLRKHLEAWTSTCDKLDLEDAAREAFVHGDQAIRKLIYDPLLPEPLINDADRLAFVNAVKQFDDVGRRLWRQFLQGAAAA